MGWDGTGTNCYGMGWDRKICPMDKPKCYDCIKYFNVAVHCEIIEAFLSVKILYYDNY